MHFWPDFRIFKTEDLKIQSLRLEFLKTASIVIFILDITIRWLEDSTINLNSKYAVCWESELGKSCSHHVWEPLQTIKCPLKQYDWHCSFIFGYYFETHITFRAWTSTVWYFAARKLQFRLRSGSHKKGYLIKFASLAKSFIDKKVKNRTTNVPWLNLAFELVRKYHNWHNTVYICGN